MVDRIRVTKNINPELNKKQDKIPSAFDRTYKAEEIVSDTGGFVWNDNFQDQIRSYCLDFGLPLENNEMSRSFYLKNRLSETENKNLLTIVNLLSKSSAVKKFPFQFGLFAVGSSTYSEKYYADLKNMFVKRGLSEDDHIMEVSWINGEQFSNFNDYESYRENILRENKSRAFDEQLDLVSKDKFERIKKIEQKEYRSKKLIKDILNNKGEDLDLIIVPDPEVYDHFEVGNYELEKFSKFGFNFKQFSLDAGLDVIEESSYLGDHEYKDYRAIGGNFERIKEIKDRYKTLRISFDEGRSFHFYFKPFSGVAWKRQEIINNGYFVQLIRRSNTVDLESAIKNGFKTGTYENPFVLKYLKK